ncbi:cold-shock protein [Chitinophaga sp. PC15]|uniref:Cold-shock protein n=1 Tax=Chitinophaga nivalis TaxID=2991709 RepID=A0ABT3IWE5_9BACT|nr:cold-shock protein [Chitinophaga nivalis]MCW3488298.1 cold-shock protein [Chitinophaga nivalis]
MRHAAPVSERYNGTIKWFNIIKGYGFITRDVDGLDLFVHFSDFDGLAGLFTHEGQRVSFEAEMGPKGLQARNVRRL